MLIRMNAGATERAADAAYQGARGAFSEEAALAVFSGLGRAAELLPCATFDDLFDAVESERARSGVVPVENSLAGAVDAAIDLLLSRDVRVVGETILRVSHMLIGCPGASIDALRRVESHPVALAQCHDFLRANSHLEPVPVFDTAGAVERVTAAGDPTVAAIASKRAAAIYGGSLLAEAIEDDAANFTRFFVVRPGAGDAAPPTGRVKIALAYTPARNPAGLVDGLGALAAAGLSLTRVEPRPIRGAPFEYRYLVEAEADAAERVSAALSPLGRSAAALRLLGLFAPFDPA